MPLICFHIIAIHSSFPTKYCWYKSYMFKTTKRKKWPEYIYLNIVHERECSKSQSIKYFFNDTDKCSWTTLVISFLPIFVQIAFELKKCFKGGVIWKPVYVLLNCEKWMKGIIKRNKTDQLTYSGKDSCVSKFKKRNVPCNRYDFSSRYNGPITKSAQTIYGFALTA